MQYVVVIRRCTYDTVRVFFQKYALTRSQLATAKERRLLVCG